MAALVAVLVIIALVGADQAVKYWAVEYLKPEGSMEFIHIGKFRILDLTYLENDGAIFGSMSGQRWFLIGFTALILAAGIVILIKYRKRSKLMNTAFILFIAGGIGNLADRIRFGYVVDMFEIKLFRFAIFNAADVYVTVAVVILLIYVIFADSDGTKKRKSGKIEKNE